jgi:D-alanyl-D-alanine carboxypeptidase
MMKLKKIINKIRGKNIDTTLSIVTIILCSIIAFVIIQQFLLFRELKETEQAVNETYQEINKKFDEIETVLLSTQEQNLTFEEALEEARKKSEDLKREFAKVEDNVDELEKITTTDPELLRKYSKIYFLNENYVPEDLKTIPSEFTYNPDRKYEIHSEVWPYLKDLLEEAEEDGIDIQVISAFRSFGEQAQLKGAYTVTYGAGTANQFSADQGYSEHQLGTTVDFTNAQVGATFSGFAQTETYAWLLDNAHRFGFTLSYPENNEFYQFEPWHWRFVGEDLAEDLHDDERNLYDLSQREINEYIADLFD